MRRLSFVLPVVLVGCASVGGAPTPAGSGPGTVVETTRVSIAGSTQTLVDQTVTSTKFVSSNTLSKPLADVWGAVPDIWASLGLTIDGISQKDHRITSGIIRAHRELGKVSLSRYVDCGRSTLGYNADSYFVQLKVETVVSGVDGAVIVQSALQATGEGTGNGGQTMRCSSTGVLENRIAERLAARLK